MKRIFIPLLLLTSPLFAQRLPKTVIPNHYQLSLDPRIDEKKFSGEETIEVRLLQPMKEIVLNSLELEISEAQVAIGANAVAANVVYDKPDEMARLEFAEQMPAGNPQIHLKFSGPLTEGLRGLYLSKSSRRLYAVTQFEGTYARMMFPCFDEPSFKATFDLAVTAAKGDTAISNGRLLKDEPTAGGRHQITFSTSPRMSTYLLALAIGDWQCLSRAVDGVPIRVCAVPERKQYGAFALDVAEHSIGFYNQWYGIKYPFGKLDMLAIPDYEWGGMENTASIFYRESALLLNESNASVLRKRGQASTIAHEIAHQWFGDLVTAAWWDDIWLNEGFATWMSSKPIAAWHPEWRTEQEAAARAQHIIALDSLASARAIHGDPSTPSEIKEMFDGITYEKGAAVLRMLEAALGAEVFRQGVNAYLAAHANGNATSSDFWQAEAGVSGKPVDQWMRTFILQAGVPVVDFTASCDGKAERLRLRQQRLRISGEAPAAAGEQLWQIPFCAKTSALENGVCGLLKSSEDSIVAPGCADWVFGNVNAQGYYRVAYSSEDLRKVGAAAEDHLNVPERIALVEDSWAMTRTGKNTASDFVSLSDQLRSEQNLHVIDALSSHLDYLQDAVVEPDQRAKFEGFVRAQFASISGQLGWDPRAADTDDQRALRASLLEILGGAGDHRAVAVSRRMVDEYIKAPASVDGTLIGSAFTVASENGDEGFYARILEALNNARSTDSYYHYLYALTNFRQPDLLVRTVSLIDQGKVRQQDYPRFFSALLANPEGRDRAWQYLKDHWDDLAQKVTSFGGAGAISALGNGCSIQMRDDVERFFDRHSAPGAERAVRQSLERIGECVAFKKTQQASMRQWLEAYKEAGN